MNEGKKKHVKVCSLVTMVCLKTFPGDAVVQMGWQMEISPSRTGRGVFVDILVRVKQGRENKGEAAISSYNLFLVHSSQSVS